MSWMNIIHKAKTQSGQMITGADRLAPKSLLTDLPSSVPPQIDSQREREMRSKENLKANLDARMKQVNANIKSKQLEIDNETRGKNNQLKLDRLGKDMNILRGQASKIEQQNLMNSGKKLRQAAALSNNVKNILRTEGNKAPARSVRQTTENVPRPTGNVALPSVQGTTPTKDPLVGFAQDKGLMPQTTQTVPRPMGNVPINRPPSLPKDAQGNVIPAKTPTKPIQNVALPNQVGRITDKANELGLNREQMQQVTEEARQQASQPTYTAEQIAEGAKMAERQKQRTGPPPKKMTTAQLNQQAQQRRQEPVNDQNKKLYGEKYLEELRRFSAVSPKQQKKDAKAQKRLARDRQKLEEKEAKRKAKQNPRGGRQLVPRGTGRRQNPALVPRGTGRRENPVLRPKQTGVPIGKSDEFSKSIKDILRR